MKKCFINTGFLLIVFCMGLSAQEESDFIWESDNYDGIVITGYIGSGGDVRIPSTINGIPVTAIGDLAFSREGPNEWTFWGRNLTSVYIPDTVVHIGWNAFINNLLTCVTIPSSVTHIGGGAFSQNRLTSVIIPDSVIHIGLEAFANNYLSSVIIPNGVISISDHAFWNNLLENVIIPNSITTIGFGAFLENRLTNIVLPSSLTSIGNWAFASNYLPNVIIPSSVTHIGGAAFADNPLTSITIGENVFLGATHGGGILNEMRGTAGNTYSPFDRAYNNAGRQAGTYIRQNVDSTIWTRK